MGCFLGSGEREEPDGGAQPIRFVEPGEPQMAQLQAPGNPAAPAIRRNFQRRMTTKLWPSLSQENNGREVEEPDEHVEDRIAALRLQDFLKKHEQDMQLGILSKENPAQSQFDDRIHALFERTNDWGALIHRPSEQRVSWLKTWITTPFLMEFLARNWSHVNFSPFMTLENVEDRLRAEREAIVVRLSSTIPGFITVSCNAKDTQQPIHVRYQIRHDLSIRGEQNLSYASFEHFIASFDQMTEGIVRNEPGSSLQASEPDVRSRQKSDPIARFGPQASHVALYARTSDIRNWELENGEQEVEGEQEVTSTLLEYQKQQAEQS